jgi:threonine dehydrogenase-like Zn-dependent dehydrogenase
VLEVTYAGICGTDLHIAHNSFPSWPPVTLGHEFTGRVDALGAEVRGWSVGDRVVCEPTAVAVTAAERMPVEPGSTVVVFGPGAVGLLAAMVVRACGAGRTLSSGRRRAGRGWTWPAGSVSRPGTQAGSTWPGRRWRSPTGGGPIWCWSARGRPRRLPQASPRSAGGGLCVLGMSGRPRLEVPWGLAMQRALDVGFSLSSSWSSWDGALALMARGVVDPTPLATVYPLSDWQAAFAAIQGRTVVKALLDPRAGDRPAIRKGTTP